LSFPGIELDVFNLHHGRDREPAVENLGFLVDVEGVRFLHIGDTEATRDELMALQFGSREIDIAFIPYWKLLWGEPGFAEDAIGSARLAAMHIPSAQAQSDYFGEFDDLEGLVGALEQAYPGILVFVQPIDTRTITR
jgi:L-ascorbate metabolism protein UlaG (beta-lactamase superfamily)